MQYMKLKPKQIAELKELCSDLYEQGYQCGILEDANDWFEAYVLAIEAIITGEFFSDDLVRRCFNEVQKQNSRSNSP